MIIKYSINDINNIHKEFNKIIYDKDILCIFNKIKNNLESSFFKKTVIEKGKSKTITEIINSNLNKLSKKNFENILNIIYEIINVSDENINILLENIILNNQNLLFINLIVSLNEKKNITDKLSYMIKNFLNKNELIIMKCNLENSDENYEKLCAINKKKDNLKNFFIFLNHLHKKKIYDVFKNINFLFDQLDDELISLDYIELYIELIIILLQDIKLEKCCDIKKKLTDISKDKDKYNSRSRFTVLDYLDYLDNID